MDIILEKFFKGDKKNFEVNGTFGGCNWKIENNQLTLSGGLMDNVSNSSGTPWHLYADQIIGVYVNPGVKTNTGAVGIFAGWNTNSTGTSTTYDEGALYNPGLAPNHSTFKVTLYAKWTPIIVVVNIQKDEVEWSASGIKVALYQNGVEMYSTIIS